ncbi:MAG: hypothetical protein HW375_764, partial [Anaerolineales bacterium]|nr:hypothetical protein [Anaerolineales bacterium]
RDGDLQPVRPGIQPTPSDPVIKHLERWPVHPFLFALYPVLALLAVNAQDVPPQAAVRPI